MEQPLRSALPDSAELAIFTGSRANGFDDIFWCDMAPPKAVNDGPP
jgi:hypothetical protein